MSAFALVIGNKNYSSWSLRGWLAARQAGIDFTEELVLLQAPDYRKTLLAHSPAAKVPVLKHGEQVIWDTLAIIETLAELRPAAGLWPEAASARAHARSISAEMHAGFAALRSHMPMNLRASLPGKGRGPGVEADISRITEIFRDCRARFGQDGPFLFGPVSAADAMYAPVIARFRTYAVPLDPDCQAYADAILAWPAFVAWQTAALDEPWIVPEDEID